VWDVNDGSEIAILPCKARVNDAVFSPDGQLLAAAISDATTRVFDVVAQPKLPPIRRISLTKHVL
jgi:WD40 repeat protein